MALAFAIGLHNVPVRSRLISHLPSPPAVCLLPCLRLCSLPLPVMPVVQEGICVGAPLYRAAVADGAKDADGKPTAETIRKVRKNR